MMSCLFCYETESVRHLFFECCVAKVFWKNIYEIIGLSVGADFELVAKVWLGEKKFKAVNVCTTAALWTSSKMRNALCFQGVS
jgi:hypothetical protein